MRFILFNITVGAALVYLFNGGDLPLDSVKRGLEQTKAQIAQLGEPKLASEPVPLQQLVREGKSHGRDVIRDPKPTRPAPVSKPKSKSKTTEPVPATPQLNKPISIAKHPAPKPVSQTSASTQGRPMPSAVAERRTQVLATGKPEPVTLKAGTSMMLASERRRELDALVEEMEMTYIDKIGD